MSSAPISMVIVAGLTRTETSLRAWIRPRAIFCPSDHDDAAVAGPALHGHRRGRRGWRWPGAAGAAQPLGLVPGQRVGPGAQQLAGARVEVGQGVLLDADAQQPPGQGPGGQQLPAA
jgi:hypothetical protein